MDVLTSFFGRLYLIIFLLYLVLSGDVASRSFLPTFLSNWIARQTMDWISPDFKKKRRHPRVTWASTIKKDLDLLGLTWREAVDLTKDRSEWRNCTARCASTARGSTKV